MSATAAQLARSSLPTSNPLQGGARRYVQTVALMRNVAATGATPVFTSPFQIWTPSTRLHQCATIGFRPDSGEDAAIPNGFVATLDAWAKTDRQAGGFPIRGNGILPGPFTLSTQLPWSYEAVTGVDQWRGIMTAPGAGGGTGLAVTGTFYLTVTWEPAPGTSVIDDVELQRLFDTCKVFAGGNPTVFQSAG